MASNDKPIPRWPPLAVAIAAGQTVRDAAAAAGIGERTAHRWVRRPAFRRRVAELRDAATAAAVGRLSDAMSAAADRLRSLLDAPDPRVQLGAARATLELGLKLREHGELAERLRELEGRLEPQTERTLLE